MLSPYSIPTKEIVPSFVETSSVAFQEVAVPSTHRQPTCAAPLSNRNFNICPTTFASLPLYARRYHRLITYAGLDERISWATWRMKKTHTIPGLDSTSLVKVHSMRRSLQFIRKPEMTKTFATFGTCVLDDKREKNPRNRLRVLEIFRVVRGVDGIVQIFNCLKPLSIEAALQLLECRPKSNRIVFIQLPIQGGSKGTGWPSLIQCLKFVSLEWGRTTIVRAVEDALLSKKQSACN
jgi:hypothetical protein